MKTKILKPFLAVAVVCSLSVTAFASGNLKPTTIPYEEHVDAIEHSLSSLSDEKELYGFENIRLSELKIGSIIPTYEVYNNQLSPLEDITCYQLLDESNDVVSMAFVYEIEGNYCATISDSLLNSLNKYLESSESNPYALIYDSTGVSIWDGSQIVQVIENDLPLQYRSSLSDVSESDLASIRLDNAAYLIQPVNITVPKTISNKDEAYSQISLSSVGDLVPTGYDDEAAYINPPFRHQPSGSNWCWAACMASMITYETGRNITTQKIGDTYANGNETVGANINFVCSSFEDYDLYYSLDNSGTTLVSILNSLGNDHPVFAGSYNPFYAHAVVIRGINTGNKSISVMDPAVTEERYLSGNISNVYGNNGTISYVSPNSGMVVIVEKILYM